jgi:hypothetical protein
MNPEETIQIQQKPPPQRRINRAALWFGLLGGGVAWTGHLLSAYLIGEFGCVSGLGERHIQGVTVVAWLVLAASLAALLLAGAATLIAYRTRERLAGEPQPDCAGDESNPGLEMAHTGLVASTWFVLIIAVETIPIFYYLRHC